MKKTLLLALTSFYLIKEAACQDVNDPLQNSWFEQNWLWVLAVIVLIILIAIVTGTANASKRVTSVKKTTFENGVTIEEETKLEEE